MMVPSRLVEHLLL